MFHQIRALCKDKSVPALPTPCAGTWSRILRRGRIARRVGAVALALLLNHAGAPAQPPGAPVPLFPTAPPRSFEPEPLPPLPASPEPSRSPGRPPAAEAAPIAGRAPGAPSSADPATARVFCDQPVAVRLAERQSVAERHRGFVGIWSDAAWTPQLCAALIVENVAPDGTATIIYAFGPMGSAARGAGAPGGVSNGGVSAGGVLHGTGIVRDGELRFQNSDGSQFAFRPLYSDLDGRLTTPQGQSHHAIFKKTP